MMMPDKMKGFVKEPLLNSDDVELLFTEFDLIHLIYHRNANQHRTATWWKSFNVLHRKLRQLLLIFLDIEQINALGTRHKLTTTRWNKLGRLRHRTKQLTQKAALQLTARARQNALKLSRYIVKDVIPKCYLMCYTILQTGEFITLGFALLALVSRVYFLLRKIKGLEMITVDKLKAKEKITNHILEHAKTEKVKIINEEEEDVGVAMIFDDSSIAEHRVKEIEADVNNIVAAAKTNTRDHKVAKKGKDKKRKKRKSVKDAMDDIFGF